ncbi:MAG: D-alanyl-D-alanine carboxypeptidase family protein, partial [Candidatus Sericytochromatia bacterium]|nr:D-alanyl-D-alanine carboxypeptidase family protein [Candidatus Tanganyikabacteria bacterium]
PEPKPEQPAAPRGSGPLLRRGTRGEAVTALQRRLADLGFDPGPIDGIFGPRTEAAVKAFQTARRIEIDGIVGPQTWGELGIKVDAPVQRPDPGANLDVGRDGDMATVQGFKMTPATAEAFVKMAQAASRDGITLRINSAWRSDEHQARLYAEAIKKYGSEQAARKWVAPPGKSNHRTGKALDIHTSDAIYAWLKSNAPRFGFRQPMSWEPWHWEFEG